MSGSITAEYTIDEKPKRNDPADRSVREVLKRIPADDKRRLIILTEILETAILAGDRTVCDALEAAIAAYATDVARRQLATEAEQQPRPAFSPILLSSEGPAEPLLLPPTLA